jgi:hypothetical protein
VHLAEPTEVFCVDAATGKLAWSGDNPKVDALTGDEATRAKALVMAAEQADRDLGPARAAYSKMLRAARAGGSDEGIEA